MKRNLEKSLYQDNKTIYFMKKKKNNKFSTFKKKKSHERKVADHLVNTHERNEKLRDKKIGKGERMPNPSRNSSSAL